MAALTSRLTDHTSGCSYEMVAAYVKGKRRIIGRNKLSTPARLKSPVYPAIAGVHAELAVYAKAKERLRGGTLYVTGVRSTKSRRQMLNTKPCKYCMYILTNETDIKAIVYWRDGELVKEFL